MSTEEDRAPPSTEVSPQRHPSDGLVQVQAAVAEERLTIGEKLSGRYRIERELGEGGMGVVYLARDEQIAGEVFAIKVLKGEIYPEALSLLREEVRKTRKLSHPNTVDVHSVNLDGRRLYVLMEYLEGKSLDALLREEFGRGMSFSHAWPIIEDVGAALGNAHDHNVIHSDLKPANVFVTTAGRTKLLDFGIARVSRARWGLRALTPVYASCEMLEGKEADRRDDIYSFACVIYEMLSGERPFGDLTALDARQSHAKVPPLEGLSREQNAALAQALAFNRNGRTPSVEKLLEGLGVNQNHGRRPMVVLGSAIIAGVVALGLTYLVVNRTWFSRQSVVIQSVVPKTQQAAASAAATTLFNPPPHSIAVLPFVNMSGDPRQEYFSDGLTEELLNSLSHINELQVAARTSSFSFQGAHPDIATVAHKLNVASVLEGSVRRSGRTVRITAQLDNAVTGFHIWSQTYDRDLGDVLQLQTEIATAVASALKVTLLADEATRIELGGTRNPAAFDAYLRGLKAYNARPEPSSYQSAIAAYTEAIRLDANYALAFAGRSSALTEYVGFATGAAIGEGLDRAQADARQALKLAPELAEGHLALARYFLNSLDFTRASEAFERAMALAPGNAQVLAASGRFAGRMGHFDVGVVAGRHAVALDPLNPRIHGMLGSTLYLARRYEEAIAAWEEVVSLDPDVELAYARRGLAYYGLGDFQSARSSCQTKPDYWRSQSCLAVTYDKLGQHAEAEAALKKLQAAKGDAEAFSYATIYAQWGDTAKALEWLVATKQMRYGDLIDMKSHPLLDPLRQEPRFQAIERELKFPD